MTIKGEIKRILGRFSAKKKDKKGNIMTDEEIGEYKRNAWNSDQSTQTYKKNVEYNFFNAITSRYFTEYLNPTDKVLDVGAGTGRLSFIIADIGCEVTSTDISRSMLKILEETKGNRNIKTILSDGENLPLEDTQFDAVVSMDLMLHFPNWKDFLKEKTRVCKSGGYIIYNFYSGENLNNISNDKTTASNYISNAGFVAQCTKEELQQICDELGLEIIKLQPYNFLAGNGLWSPNLNIQEAMNLRVLYYKILTNVKIMNIIKEFEQTIVKNLSHEDCAMMIVVLRKR